MARINGDRLLADLRRMRQFGATGPGVVRPALSPVDIEARHWLAARMDEAGLDAVIDGVGTVYGRSRRPGPTLLIGSHTDTQPTGGWLDGVYGVICGLEIARALAADPATQDLAVDVASWMDEEGTYAGYLGSRSFVGEPVEDLLLTSSNAAGESLAAALTRAGFAGRPRVTFDPSRHVAYLEPHIEQGGRLETAAKAIGIVTTIVGIREMRVTFTGQRNHAGTTPMAIRRDAGAALVSFVPQLDAAFRALADADTVWTNGKITLEPGSLSVIPGQAELLLQFRDGDAARLQAMEQALTDLVHTMDAQGPVRVGLSAYDLPAEPVAMDSGLQRHIAAVAEMLAPGQWMAMPSGAGHDAQVIAQIMPASMLFVPSIGGISHDFTEDTGDDHIVLGCAVAAEAAIAILRSR